MGEHLVAMIDGSAVGFALAKKVGDAVALDKVWNGKTADFPTFTDALQHFLHNNGLRPIDYRLGLAVAGVPRGDIISLANCRWFISVSGLRAFLRTEPLVLNDFAATAWSLTALDRNVLTPIGGLPARPIGPRSTYLVLGAGCGLGMATLHVTAGGEVVILDSEGGHSSFAPQNPAEEAMLPHLRRQFSHVSYERLLSDAGLQNIYRAIAARDGKQVSVPDAATICASAKHRSDPIASETLKIFASTLGSFAGSVALTLGSWDGVFLTGDMMRDLHPLLAEGEFRRSFTAKGRFSKALLNVPTVLVNCTDSRLLGAAAALLAKEPQSQDGWPMKAVAG